MMEIDPLYCGVILDRWQEFSGKIAHRDDGGHGTQSRRLGTADLEVFSVRR